MSTDSAPFWHPATYQVSIVATCTRCGNDHVPASKEAAIEVICPSPKKLSNVSSCHISCLILIISCLSLIRVQAWDIRDAFAAMKREQPVHISTVMKEVGFPTITLNDIERWANPDANTHDASDLSAGKTLQQLERCAMTAMTMSNPSRLGKVLLATEVQQKAIAATWPAYRKINREQYGWVSKIHVNHGPSGGMEWWTRALDENTRGADQELVPARKARIADALVPFLTAWRVGSRAHRMSRAICPNCQ
ncbi:hypothetical protein F5Y16DRAFT_208607 [Xylariaceae sp. FL0255]|nr:hypothetical protein F5Y16DRAFT_208607 [Xylariaceae sp. FL0255]